MRWMHTEHNPTMASAASPSAADPKIADLCNHTAHASLSDGFAEDGYFKRPIQPNIHGGCPVSVLVICAFGYQHKYDTDIFLNNLLDDKCSACSYL